MLPFRSGRARNAALSILGILATAALAAEPSPSPSKKREAGEKKPNSLANIPLPIGQEAKGLVLPDFDLEGHLRARLEAGTAKRIDEEHVEFRKLKVTTFTPQNTIDLMIEMPVSQLDLTTRVIHSTERTTVQRTDFRISGDTMKFDTIGRKGTLTGRVKMVVTNQSGKSPKKNK